MMGHCLFYLWEYLGIYFTTKSAIHIHLSFFCSYFPPELQLNKANTADTEAPFLDLHLSISNGFVSMISAMTLILI